jgi:DNA helicase-2/ATP-dependent DNA helicase PcrA
MTDDFLNSIPGPVLLLSGPGTGKTHRIGRRLKYLVENRSVPPDQITVITFTAAAALNMREKISDNTYVDLFIPYSVQPQLICTMHSLGYKILRENAEQLDLQQSLRVVADDYLRSILMGDAAQIAGFTRFSGEEAVACRRSGRCKPEDSPKCAICDKYRAILKSCSAVDYDEQILLACRILKENSGLITKYRALTRHLLIDEYQDINAAQFELISLLSEGQRDGLFVVGDDDQSIYSWRGGSPAFIRNFGKYFGSDTEAKVVELLESFRCHRHILEGAMAVVQKYDNERSSKGQFEYKMKDGPKIQIHNVPSDEKEAEIVRKIIHRVIPSQDVLVLFPQRQYSMAIAAELRAHQIPFSAPVNIPGTGFPLIATVALWLGNPADNLSFRRCLEAYMDSPASPVPSSKVKKQEKKEQRNAAYANISHLWDKLISGQSTSLWENLKADKDANELIGSTYEAFSKLIELNQSGKDLGSFSSCLANELAPWRTIPDFLEEVTTWVEHASQMGGVGVGGDVRLMTFQGAKGLQAKVVIVVGLEEGSLPRSEDKETLAEQSRLLFVSMTRAINELHLFHARKRSGAVALRNIYKEGSLPDIKPSRFLGAIPKEHRDLVYHKA